MHFAKIYFFILCLISCSISFSQSKNDVYGKINIDKKDNFITLKAEVNNDGLLHIDKLFYNLIALKKGKGGNYSNNRQSGEFSIQPNENMEVSIIKVNLNEDEELKVYLFIKKNEKLISKDSLWILPKNIQQEVAEKTDEKDFFLKGIVVDEAITKIGKDYHDLFYQSYLLSGIKHPFIIKIKEKPGMGRTSIILVEVEEIKIHEFFSRPDEEFLKLNVGVALERLYFYAKQREELRKKSKM
ncbi:CsgE family curli-type amyloid fiber assembly protein [Polaribacter sp. 11A2H]|uniref:CsgE family curli-type amyloid fiber assembly protein n=1 Tax=Polaribacter sp. 11A2H TaxID=2687290 RepID=UPI00140C2220|nr:CsgE family curli-type amyloid fiber assembly protein [Polaribacter sp. 11A2H]